MLVVPEIVGRTLEVTRGIVKVSYSQEKPKVEVSVEDEESGSRESIDLDWFLSQIPEDLREPYRKGAERWAKIGFLSFGTSGISWKIRLGSSKAPLIYSYPTYGITLTRKQDFAKWSDDQEIYARYLRNLEGSAVATNTAREGKQYLKHEKMTANDLEIILNATVTLAEDLLKQK